ncbi:MAG: hypothetical protein HQ506_11615 [Candidatus Marinimicrobia bacterium]|nr:hypothetical protein [Candidatus Neomarinimicrobiota bacterium]
MKRVKVPIHLALFICIFLPEITFADSESTLNLKYKYGQIQLLPSLKSDSGIEYSGTKMYSDLWAEYSVKISEKISFDAAVEVTDQPHQLIGTNYSRPDYPITTGRVQRSVVRYATNSFAASFGRDDMLKEALRPRVFQYPASGDGFSWKYHWNKWHFKHVFQILPAEEENTQVFRRSISYHHLSRVINNFTLGVGEYFILTGHQIGFDLKRLNPFIPYFVNSFDSKPDIYPGFEGDSDNSLIKLFLSWGKNTSQVSLSLYVDEFQIDAADREVFNDAMLLSLSAINELELFGHINEINWGFSASNPNFGQHPGPFTTTSFAVYPLFEYTPGMKQLVFVETKTPVGESFHLFLGGYSERWVNIAQLTPELMNKRIELDLLKVYSDSRLSVGFEYDLKNYPLKIGSTGWVGSGTNSSSGFLLNLQFNRNSNPKR